MGTNQRTASTLITPNPDDGDSPRNVGYYLPTQAANR
jgi:hypothetical protein